MYVMLTIEIHTGLGSVNSERNFPFWRTIPLKICILQRHRLISLYISCSILMNYTHKTVWIFFCIQDYSFVGHVEAISCGLGPIKGTDVAFDGPSAGVIAVENVSLSLFFSTLTLCLGAKELLSRQTVNKKHFNKTSHSPKANITDILAPVSRTTTSLHY